MARKGAEAEDVEGWLEGAAALVAPPVAVLVVVALLDRLDEGGLVPPDLEVDGCDMSSGASEVEP